MRLQAAERRKIHSLGREPQDTDEKKEGKPRSGDRGSMEAYLRDGLGVTDEEVALLREELLD